MKRLTYSTITLIVLLTGYLSRQNTEGGSFIHAYVGDAIWAGMIYFGFRTLMPNVNLKKSLYAALIFTYCIEITQLYQADWINAVRHTRFGGLVLGFNFLWSDLVMYALGIISAYLLDFSITRKVSF